jgi:uncharacterized iron-regulated membrane protein
MLTTFVRRPQRLWARRMLFQIHLWAGILLSLYLAVIGLTGSLLVFEDEFTALLHPLPSAASAPARPSGLVSMIAAAERSVPSSRAIFISFPEQHQSNYRVWLNDSAGHQAIAFIDPATGVLLARQGRTWIEWVHDLHVYLLLGPSGLIVNGIGAAVLLLLAATGLVLWWPGLAHWSRALKVRVRGSWRRINFDLHSALGFWTLGIVLWWTVSGIYFAWPVQVGRFVNAFSALKGMRPPSIPPEPASPAMPALEPMVKAAREATPGGSVSGIALPPPQGGSVIVYVDRLQPGDFSHRDIHYFSASSGKLVATWHYGQNQSAGDWVLWAMHPLHFGTLWGLGPKILWALFGLSLPTLAVTGLLMYWNRKLRFLLRPR